MKKKLRKPQSLAEFLRTIPKNTKEWEERLQIPLDNSGTAETKTEEEKPITVTYHVRFIPKK